MSFQINEAAIRALQERANEIVRAVTRDVAARMTGSPVDEVELELDSQLRAANVQPNPDAVRRVAEEIHAGTLSDGR